MAIKTKTDSCQYLYNFKPKDKLRNALFPVKHFLHCAKRRKMPLKRGLVNSVWYYKLKARNCFTRKIKVGFGPIQHGEDNLGMRKWRIDPIVDHINKTSSVYSADIFLDPWEVIKFDIIVIVKVFDDIEYSRIEHAKSKGKFFVYDINDNPYLEKPAKAYDKNPDFIEMMNGVIASSPLHFCDLSNIQKNIVLIEHPILNNKVTKYNKRSDGVIRLVWQGYQCNRNFMDIINPVIQRLRRDLNKDVRVIYSTNQPSKKDGFIEYKSWNIDTWMDVLAECDIGIVIKPLDDYYQQRKPSSKIQSYMAAGLPVVCTPCESDKLVIEHGKTGYFAYTDEDWYTYLKDLIEKPELRKSIGMAGREYVTENYSEYFSEFDLKPVA